MENPEVTVSDKGTYHVRVKDILNSERGKKQIELMQKFVLNRKTH